MKHLKVFETEGNFENFKNSSGYVTPNISFMRSSGRITNKPHTPPPAPAMAGDVAYWDGSKVKTTPLSKWKASLGTPVGVVVVPEGFAPGGKARIISLYGVDKNGNRSNVNCSMYWGGYGPDMGLEDGGGFILTDNAGSTSVGYSWDWGWLPSDKFDGEISFVDPITRYNLNAKSGYLAPSPYMGNTPNPEYHDRVFSYGDTTKYNALALFNGYDDTRILVEKNNSDLEAANACWKYNDGASNLQWYLPAMGELGYLTPRQGTIETTLEYLGGVGLTDTSTPYKVDYLRAVTESGAYMCYGLDVNDGRAVGGLGKDLSYYVRPFAFI